MYNYTSFISSTDRFGVFGTEEYQIQKLARRLKAPIEDILKAIQEVGFDQDEIEEYIRDRYNRS
ncbi:DUF3606 domain-containing protein [Flavisolibacter tropicus]|uniref:DUF3606 domain-containing protein n=1 Tax=Flavisolibacter tropicus TaxID=1492898 RepID=A0A172TS30_9BACT|nr:DUF3606 domain-containing protein [Flavisolibacter tropicus]ANE49788.1 hypothetical protein SY85_04050 [Flavisolibacter tropicus]